MSKLIDEWVLKICVTGPHPETAQLIRGNSEGKFGEIQNYIRETTGVDVIVKRITVDDQKIKILLWDVASQPVFGKIRPMHFERAFACIFLYEKNNRKNVKKSVQEDTYEEEKENESSKGILSLKKSLEKDFLIKKLRMWIEWMKKNQ